MASDMRALRSMIPAVVGEALPFLAEPAAPWDWAEPDAGEWELRFLPPAIAARPAARSPLLPDEREWKETLGSGLGLAE